jgi:hypothetical protein
MHARTRANKPQSFLLNPILTNLTLSVSTHQSFLEKLDQPTDPAWCGSAENQVPKTPWCQRINGNKCQVYMCMGVYVGARACVYDVYMSIYT